MKKILSLILCLSTCYLSLGLQSQNRTFESAQFSNKILIVNVNDGYYRFVVFSDEIIECSFIPLGETYINKSHALTNTIPQEAIYTEKNNTIELETRGVILRISKVPFKIRYYYKGDLLIEEGKGYVKDSIHETLNFNISSEESLYGGGARALGMNRRGYKLELYNKAHYGYETHSELMNFTMPLVLSSKQYAIHFDNTAVGYIDLDSKKNNTLRYATVSGRKTYQVIASASWENLISAYTGLTGRQPMPPRWALGNFASRFGYHSQEEVENTVDAFDKAKIPLDAVILDLYWFGKTITGTMGNLEVDRDAFPNFENMIKEFKKKGIQTITITEPFILTTSKKWDEAVKKEVLAKNKEGNPYTYDFYFGHTGLIDIYSPSGSSWFWSIYKKLHQMGIAGVWGDLGEPEVHPDDLIHATGTAPEVHNVYGHDWAKLIFKGYQKEYPKERPFILMRAGYSGSQRYGMIPWSGDVNRSWGGLQSQPEIALQMGMQGMAYMHSDLGGFAGPNLDDELYVRWLQYGVFQPIFRPHAQEEVPSEPVFRTAEAMALSKKAIELRYRLLPYNYNLSYNNHSTGVPMMRPLFFYNKDHFLEAYTKSYLWGDAFLVSPVIDSGIERQELYFPKGEWYDFYSGALYSGGKEHRVTVSKNYIPTFVKAGSFVPMAKDLMRTADYSGNEIELHYYYGSKVSNSSYSLYNDDGITAEAYEKGEFEILNFNATKSNKELSIAMHAVLGENYKLQQKAITLFIHHLDAAVKKIKVNGKAVAFNHDESFSKISVPVLWHTSKPIKIAIKTKNKL